MVQLIVIQTFEMAMQRVGVNDIVSLGSDGASVYTGVRNGVIAKLEQSIPWLLGIHCTVLLTTWNWLSLMDSERNNYFFSLKDMLQSFYKHYHFSMPQGT